MKFVLNTKGILYFEVCMVVTTIFLTMYVGFIGVIKAGNEKLKAVDRDRVFYDGKTLWQVSE